MRDSFLGMPLWLAVIASVLIIFVRGQAYYWIGRGVGPRVYASRVGRRVGEHHLRRVEGLVSRRGALAVFAAHWVAGLRHAIPICAGVTRMPMPRYLVASALGSLLWTPPWVVGGYAVVWGWLEVFGRSPLAAAGLAAVLAVAVGALVAVRRRRRRNGRDADQSGSSSSAVG
ncbi:DedA family protein [Actinomadura sp. NPDC047616]|uniref:DedA family protein n=1 Tax=Actinomadura sp. NPDC047616 TaxID=3155914 RepID=UPI00340F96B1